MTRDSPLTTRHPSRIYLTGFMGSGKTSVGRHLARFLALPFVDLDREIEEQAGLSIAEIFQRRGEAGFRELEARALEDQSRRQQAVVATGGGVVESPENVDLMLSTGKVIWLHLDFDTLHRRLARSPVDRPLFKSTEQTRELYRSRLSSYERCHLRVEAGSGTPRELARRIAELLESRGCAT